MAADVADTGPSGSEPLGRLLAFTVKELREAADRTLTAAGSSLGTWILLNALVERGEVSQAALAAHMHLEGATITHHIDRLEALGLVARSVDADDRRVRRVILTAAGAELHRQHRQLMMQFERTVLEGLSSRDRAVMRRCLARIRTNLDALGPSPAREATAPAPGFR